MSRSKRAVIGQQTVDICEQGYYVLPGGNQISISSQMQASLEGTHLVNVQDWDSMLQASQQKAATRSPKPTRISVRNCTTLAGARALAGPGQRVLALNFASAKNPGGGFLNGSQAQEESIARGTGLYPTLLKCREYYDLHRRTDTCLYTHTMIYSPQVPVIRDDQDELLTSPWQCTIVTSPAVNTGCLMHNEPSKLPRVEPVMRERIQRLLALAVTKGYHQLVLGAWGCGVFRNDPTKVAQWFADALASPEFKGAFSEVVFAVLDRDEEPATFKAFERRLT